MSAGDIKEATGPGELKKPKFVSYLWDTFDKPPTERRLLTKLDTALISFGAVGYFVKSVDDYNINNAFVSGMQEDLRLFHNQLNYMQTAWALGYMLGQIPSNIILSRTRPRYWIPSLEVCWAVLTLSSSRCNQAYQFYIIRLLIGLCESGYYPGIQHSLGSWYRRDELGKRACIFQICSALGQMASGYIMSGVYRLGGVGGFKGWQWAFIINGSISLPVAVAGYFILPDVPEITKSWYLSEEEIKLAQLRMHMEGRKPRAKYTKEKLKRIFTSWHIYLMSLLYLAFNNGIANMQPIFQQYLRHSENPHYSIPQINNYPTTTSGVQILMTIIYAWLSDTVLRGRRWPPLVFGGVVNIICYVSLAIWDIPTWWKWTSLISAGASFGLSGLCMAWANEVCGNDSEERAITLAAMNEVAYIIQIWLPLLVWQQVDAPRYCKGYITVSVMSAIFIMMCFLVRNLQNKESFAARISQRHATESCIQLQQQQTMNGEKDASSSSIQLTRLKSVDDTSGHYESGAIPPSSSSNIVSPCYEEDKARASKGSGLRSHTKPGDIKEMEVQPSRLL
ncbi:pantothenate transporter, putative [Talaromyces stipitatus ATCC 10500]|uniref:Pantothenate transporter, putative n=1 Tax=Talaromyces stipitatus (strain ATCC 10500 / CBS 375.48 / QM 6759 / NRRL 1006) TaxID=441959 RepID=B8MKR5_TALSN|nr:pantothenate transporter, putative [Talaromyces stipitatus ATCC 10500]EED14914.1 pantothenate transporter, putative [Talaromyces stipitatus ATCC 10500]